MITLVLGVDLENGGENDEDLVFAVPLSLEQLARISQASALVATNDLSIFSLDLEWSEWVIFSQQVEDCSQRVDEAMYLAQHFSDVKTYTWLNEAPETFVADSCDFHVYKWLVKIDQDTVVFIADWEYEGWLVSVPVNINDIELMRTQLRYA